MAGGSMMNVLGVIPARYGSTRLPGKPLKDIGGKPMIWWVYQSAKKAKKLNDVVIATDSENIFDICKEYGMNVIMTHEHPTAIHRLGEVADNVNADFYVQINGDEPLIDSKIIDSAVWDEDTLGVDDIWGTNIITPIQTPVEIIDPSNIKMVFDKDMNCIYMSRNAIPYPYKSLNYKFYKHVGVIGFSPRMIKFYTESVPGFLEEIEGIDLLRFVDYGKRLKLKIVTNCENLSVDTEKDLVEVRARILKRG